MTAKKLDLDVDLDHLSKTMGILDGIKHAHIVGLLGVVISPDDSVMLVGRWATVRSANTARWILDHRVCAVPLARGLSANEQCEVRLFNGSAARIRQTDGIGNELLGGEGLHSSVPDMPQCISVS